jgi:hypothetical protein
MFRIATFAAALLVSASAQAQTVAFVDVRDAVSGRFFDAATSTADGNTLHVNFNTGRDAATWKDRGFKASTEAYSYLSAQDTISFTIVPPEGYYVALVTYHQTGTASVARTGKAAGGTAWTVAGLPIDVGTFLSPTKSQVVALGPLPSVPVSITTNLHAFATPQLGSATIALTSASVVVELALIP